MLAFLSLGWCIYRDIQIEKQYPGDLRNRIVGSRLQKDGFSPYFYHWKPADHLRYYDWDNYGTTLKISNVTATPFFHQLLYPLSDLSQRVISRLWLGFEYVAFIAMTLLALRLTRVRRQQMAVLAVSLLFLYSYAWLTHIASGQLYIFVPLLAMVFYYLVSKQPSLLNAALAGGCAAMLVLIRPNAALFLLPFLLLLKNFSLKYKMALVGSGLAVLLLAFNSRLSRLYWSDYLTAMNEQVKVHQNLSPTAQSSGPVPILEQYEGWTRTQINKAQQFPYYKGYKENGNVFVLISTALHTRTPLWLLSVLSLLAMGTICLVFYARYRNTPGIPLFSIALLGYFLYMVSDLFSPIHRFSYNGIQWIFPLLLMASAYTGSFRKLYVAGVLAGLLLNSLPLYLLPLRHSVGEYLIFASLLGLLFTREPERHKSSYYYK